MTKLLYEDLSYKIIGAALEVYKDRRKHGHKKDNKSERSSIDQLFQNNSLENRSIDNSV
ncbi:MAG: hypothetical protein LWX51_09050 [Deltaproteobacteria bacterium]|jgi:hypothetical protein|nr:hypothetical protein [Deltaproteobacteria bacterium]